MTTTGKTATATTHGVQGAQVPPGMSLLTLSTYSASAPPSQEEIANSPAEVGVDVTAFQTQTACDLLHNEAEEKKRAAIVKAQQILADAKKTDPNLYNTMPNLDFNGTGAPIEVGQGFQMERDIETLKETPEYQFGESLEDRIRLWKCEKKKEELEAANTHLQNTLTRHIVHDSASVIGFPPSPATDAEIQSAMDDVKKAYADYDQAGKTAPDALDYPKYEEDTRSFLLAMGISAAPYLGQADGIKSIGLDLTDEKYGSAAAGILGLVPGFKGLKTGGSRLLKAARRLFGGKAARRAGGQVRKDAAKSIEEAQAVLKSRKAMAAAKCVTCASK